MQVLVVDDQASIRALVRAGLRPIGIKHVTEAEDGIAAVQALSRDRFALVITDLAMPRLDGMGLLRKMRETPAFAAIPVVLLTGSAVGGCIAEAVKLGVVGVIAKPFSMAVLTQRLTAIIAKLPAGAAARPQAAPTG